MGITRYIRLLVHDHTLLHYGEVMPVTDEKTVAAANPRIAHHAHAEAMVERGEAEWVNQSVGAAGIAAAVMGI